jgi:elongation factor 1 alpha-like protein
VLCPPSQPIALSTNLLVQLLVFDPTYPILAGSILSLHHHSLDLPCTIVDLVSTIEKPSSTSATGAATSTAPGAAAAGKKKRKPRVLGKGATALVRISVQSPGVPVEVNRKDLARVLLRLQGETVAAGVVVESS